MRTIAGSACLLVMLLPAPLAAAPPSGPTPVAVGKSTPRHSQPEVAKAACAPPGSCVAQASADQPDEIRAVETGQAPAPTPPSVADSVCKALATAAAENDLPIEFFTRLIWQESRFDPTAVSRAGAQGVAQFMPATASSRGLTDPFNPLEAIHQSAKLLRDLQREFGNHGLAAAAYNAGPGRVRDWLAGRRSLPRETRVYVRLVTGQSAEQWIDVQTGAVEILAANPVPCRQVAGLFARPSASEAKPADPWGVELVGSSSDAAALAAYRQLQEKYTSILAGREPRVVHHGVARGSMGWARVHVGAESRVSAEKLCANLRVAGANCWVQRN